MNEKVKKIATARGNDVINYGAGGGSAYGLLLLAERLGVKLTGEEAIALTAAALWVAHRLRPLVSALYRRVMLALAPVALLALGGCATSDCEVIYSRARAWRAIAVAAGAASASAGIATIPTDDETSTGFAIGAATLAGGTAAAGFLSDSYSDEHRLYCAEAQTSTAAR